MIDQRAKDVTFVIAPITKLQNVQELNGVYYVVVKAIYKVNVKMMFTVMKLIERNHVHKIRNVNTRGIEIVQNGEEIQIRINLDKEIGHLIRAIEVDQGQEKIIIVNLKGIEIVGKAIQLTGEKVNKVIIKKEGDGLLVIQVSKHMD